jgi:hypothetical protein
MILEEIDNTILKLRLFVLRNKKYHNEVLHVVCRDYHNIKEKLYKFIDEDGTYLRLVDKYPKILMINNEIYIQNKEEGSYISEFMLETIQPSKIQIQSLIQGK